MPSAGAERRITLGLAAQHGRAAACSAERHEPRGDAALVRAPYASRAVVTTAYGVAPAAVVSQRSWMHAPGVYQAHIAVVETGAWCRVQLGEIMVRCAAPVAGRLSSLRNSRARYGWGRAQYRCIEQ